MMSNAEIIVAIIIFSVLICFFAIVLAGAMVLFDRYMRSEKRKTEERKQARESNVVRTFDNNIKLAKIYEIRVSRGSAWEPDRAKNFMEHVPIMFDGRVAFRIILEQGKVAWQILDYFNVHHDENLVVQAIRSIYPDAEVIVSDYKQHSAEAEFGRIVAPFKLSIDSFSPITPVTEHKKTDPLATLVQSMGELKQGERLIYTLCLAGYASKATRISAQEKIKRDNTKDALVFGTLAAVDVLVGSKEAPLLPKGTGRTGRGKYIQKEQEIFEHKLYDQNLYDSCVFIQKDVVGRDADSLQLMSNPALILGTQFSGDYNVLGLAVEENFSPRWIDSREKERTISTTEEIRRFAISSDDRRERIRSLFSPAELAALWHLPHKDFTAPGINWVPGGQVPEALLNIAGGVEIGDSVRAGRSRPVFIHAEDRKHHMNIVGKTGMGKSTFMHNMIHQDIAQGRGVAVVDPHGKLVRDILRASIPDERIDDVVVLDIANEKYPPPLNPLLAPGDDPGYTASEAVAILDKMDKLPPRVGDTLTAAFVTLRYEKRPTVRDANRLFQDLEYRYRYVSQVKDIVIQEFWREYDSQSPSVQRDLRYPAIHRLRRFYRNPILHLMMCHPVSLDFVKLIREKKIILVSLGIDPRKVPEVERQLVGTVLVSQMQMAGMAFLDNPSPFHLYVDEVQNFVTAPLDKVFEEARKYGLHLTVANQYLGQLQGKLLDSVMGTVGTTVAFRIGERDARTLTPYFRPAFETNDLHDMDKYHAVIKTQFIGETMPAFIIATRPEPGDVSRTNLEREMMIRQRSIKKYTPYTKEQVLDWLNKRYPPTVQPPPSGNPPSVPLQDDTDWIDSPD